MARFKDRHKAIQMRLDGKTYTYIKERVSASKSTLSLWLRDIELTKKQLDKIKKDKISKRVESYIQTTKDRRKRIFNKSCIEERDKLYPLSTRDYFIAGLFLYLGEGSKTDWWRISISNSNPDVIRFSMFWLTKILCLDKKRLKIQLHLYNDMNIEKELKFWRKVTGLPKKQFISPYIKISSSARINHKGFGHGTCNVYGWDVKLKHQILAGIKIILDTANYGRIV
jgi:hypothetical protein